jgi:hypothetical protein
MTTQDEAVAIIKEMLQASDNEELQILISRHLPRMDNTFFSVLTMAADVEQERNPAVAARLASLAQALLPLRTLI